jgi:hypothetical protein
VSDGLADAPRPSVIGEEEYLPHPCVLHPEPVVEFPAPHELPEELRQRIRAWQDGQDLDYQYDLAVAPGWKVGGWGPWSFSDPFPMHCPECGAEVRPLLTVDSSEWDGGSGSWRPLEDVEPEVRPHPGLNEPTLVTIGRGYTMQLYVCTRSVLHPHVQNMQ